MSIKKRIAKAKIKKMCKMLRSCGIPASVYDDKENEIVGLQAELWNCVDGSAVEFGVYATAEEGYALDSYAEPEGDRDKFLAEISEL